MNNSGRSTSVFIEPSMAHAIRATLRKEMSTNIRNVNNTLWAIIMILMAISLPYVYSLLRARQEEWKRSHMIDMGKHSGNRLDRGQRNAAMLYPTAAATQFDGGNDDVVSKFKTMTSMMFGPQMSGVESEEKRRAEIVKDPVRKYFYDRGF